MRMPNTAAAIVAGGRARRFGGQDKSRLVVEGRTIIVRQVEVLQQVAGEVFIVAPEVTRFTDLGLPVYPDRIADAGAVGGIYTALDRATADRVVVVACDLPFLDARLIARLIELAEGVDGAWIQTSHGIEPLLACYQRDTRDRVLAQIQGGRLKAADLASVLTMSAIDESALATFGVPSRLLANINSPDDYARVQITIRMILPVHAAIRSAIATSLTTLFNLSAEEQPAIVIETPPDRVKGDLSATIAFELARRLRRAPRLIAQELAAAVGPIAGVSRVEATAAGYVNFFLTRPAFLESRLALSPPVTASGGKVIVEHTAINPNKAAHIGHLRNSALGDTLVRLLRFQGRTVEVQNYIDDTGVQVADVVVGFTHLESLDLAAVKALAGNPATRFDYYCWDLYARVTEWYAADKTRLEIRGAAMHAIEEGGNETADLGAFIADRIVGCHLQTMARMNVTYDLLTWEGDILRLQFWATAFEQLKTSGAVFLQTDGRLKGCWVMPIEDGAPEADADADRADDPEQREKVIVRSNGTVTYVGKDIANQFWKFGLLDRDFYYRRFPAPGHQPLWATTSTPTATTDVPPFGRASAVYNVIDSRQSYLQDLLQQALNTMGYSEQARNSTHFAYEMVALSHATARALGYEDQESSGKPFVEVSGRKGLGVKADDLIDRLIATAKGEVAARNPELTATDCARTAEAIATAAVRYFLVKYTRNKIIAFDIEEALSFEGETGPYLQYAVVRANNILAKLAQRDGVGEADIIGQLADLDLEAIDTGSDADELWNLVLEASRLDEVVDNAIRSLELSIVAKYAFGLAQAFNAFYHRQQILREERLDARIWRAAAVVYVRRQLTTALDLMGCQVPTRM